jgi:lantibiotic transport system permease protein
MNILISLRSEILKTKRTAAFYFTLIGAAVVPFMFLLNALNEGLPDEDKSNKDPLNAIFKIASEMNGIAFFPLFVVLLCTLLPQIEHKNNTWKQVLTSPKTKANIFLAKYLNILLLMVVFHLASYLFLWVVAVAIHFIIPELNVLQHPLDSKTVWLNAANTYVTVLAMSAIQFWIGLRFRNFLIPVAIGLVLWLAGTVMAFEYHSSAIYYFPHSFQIFAASPGYKQGINQVAWTSLGYAVFFLLAGFFDFNKRRMNT